MRTYVYVNRGAVEENRRRRVLGKSLQDEPTIQVWREGSADNVEGFEVEIEGPSRMVYSPDVALVPHNPFVIMALVTESPVKVTK